MRYYVWSLQYALAQLPWYLKNANSPFDGLIAWWIVFFK